LAEEQDRFDHIMAIYAAVVAHIDTAVGRFVEALHQRGALENTIIMFLSDNGGNAESGPEGKYNGNPPARRIRIFIAGNPGQRLENTPFRRYKTL